METVTACIGLGGNLGDVPAAIAAAIVAMDGLPGVRVRARSMLYRTPAWGLLAQPDFVNAAVVLETTLSADALLAGLLAIERAIGRERDMAGMRWGPRLIDLDLLLYGEAQIARDGLQVPHPHLHERAFVLVPLAEIAADAVVPGRGVVQELLARVDAGGILALPEVGR